MNINKIKVDNFWISFDIENVKAKRNGKTFEEVQAVATYTKDGEEIAKIYKLGNFEYCAKLLNNDFARSEAIRIIKSHDTSKFSPFRD